MYCILYRRSATRSPARGPRGYPHILCGVGMQNNFIGGSGAGRKKVRVADLCTTNIYKHIFFGDEEEVRLLSSLVFYQFQSLRMVTLLWHSTSKHLITMIIKEAFNPHCLHCLSVCETFLSSFVFL